MNDPSPACDPVRIGLVSISDRASSGSYPDQGIPALKDWLASALKNPVEWHTRLIPDERDGISAALRELVDIDSLLRHYGQHEPGFWGEFWPRAVALDLARPAFYGLRYARRLLGTPVPQALLAESRAGRSPPGFVVALMDGLVPEALFPPHPDRARRRTALSRLLLYVRAHWVRMPPWMLIRHLAYKFYVRRGHG